MQKLHEVYNPLANDKPVIGNGNKVLVPDEDGTPQLPLDPATNTALSNKADKATVDAALAAKADAATVDAALATKANQVDLDAAVTSLSAQIATKAENAPSVSLSDLSDVDLTGVASGNVLKYDGAKFVPAVDNTGAGGATAAADVTVAPTGSIAATNVQAALAELDTEKLALAGGTLTGKVTTLASAATGAGFSIPAGTAPTTPADGDLWYTGNELVLRLGTSSYQAAYKNRTQTWTSKQTMAASTTSTAGFNLPSGVDPTSPANGDLWTNGAALKARLNGAVQTLFHTGNSGLSLAKAPPEMSYVNATTITVKAGKCRDEDDTKDLVNGANFNIALAGAPASAHRHVLFGYDSGGAPAAVFSTTIALPAGWQAYRRIGSIRTDASGNILAFTQNGDYFALANPVTDANYSSNTPTVATAVSLTVPQDVSVVARLAVSSVKSSAAAMVDLWPTGLVADRTIPNLATGFAAGQSGLVGSMAANSTTTTGTMAPVDIETSTAGQVTFKALSVQTLSIITRGWVDRRGRDK